MTKNDTSQGDAEKAIDPEQARKEEIVKRAKERYARGIEAENDNRIAFEDDIKFYLGENHWPEAIKTMRENESRPLLTINQMPQFVKQVTNDQRQNRPSVRISPVDDAADEETAEILQGLIRSIEYNSNADVSYDNGFFYAVTGGFGFWRIMAEYEGEGFDQCLKIKTIPNSLSVVFDPDGIEPDGSDWQWGFVVDQMLEDDFEAEYPDADKSNWDTGKDEWVTEDHILVADYYEVSDYEEKEIVLLSDGRVMDKSDAPEGAEIEKSRKVREPKIKWYKIAGDDILEEGDWAGHYIPIIPVFGDSVISDNEVKRVSLIRNSKDPQRMFNYARSATAEMTALQPKAPFIAAEGQIEGYEDQWDNANNVSFSTLTYKPTDHNGTLLPPPQRQYPAQISPALEQLGINADRDLKSTMGIHEAGLGEQGNEKSGRAILARQREGDTATFHFADNMRRAIRHTGRVLIDLIPEIYDAPRTVRILGEDGTESLKRINEMFSEKGKYGRVEEKKYDMSVGRYDVIVDQGVSYNTKRQEAAELMTQLFQGNPQMMQMFGDLYFTALDMPDSDKFAERFRKVLPPELREEISDEGEGDEDMPPEVVAEIQQYKAMIQQLDQTIQQMSAELESKKVEELKVQREIEIADYNAQTERMKVENQVNNDNLSDMEKEQFEGELKVRLEKMKLDHQENMAILDAKVKLAEANMDEAIKGFDDDLNPIPSETGETIAELANQVINLTQQAQGLKLELEESKSPKRIEYGEDGRPVSVNGRRVIYNEDGKIEGIE